MNVLYYLLIGLLFSIASIITKDSIHKDSWFLTIYCIFYTIIAWPMYILYLLIKSHEINISDNMQYLDIDNINRMIKYWRNEKKIADNDERRLVASCYIDAFQTVRLNNGFGLLQDDKNN